MRSVMYVIVCVWANSDVIHAFVPPTELSPDAICILPLESPKAMKRSKRPRMMKSGLRKECQNSTLNVAPNLLRFISRSHGRRGRRSGGRRRGGARATRERTEPHQYQVRVLERRGNALESARRRPGALVEAS